MAIRHSFYHDGGLHQRHCGQPISQLPRMASKVPNGTTLESRVKRFTRWVNNERVTQTVYFLPYAQLLLAGLGLGTLVLAIDGSTVGRGVGPSWSR